jgi:hypothetical protein
VTEYTPTTDDVQVCYLYSQENPDGTFIKSQREHDAEFDRWLDTIKAEAIREAATLTTRRGQGFVYIKDILEYARRVARGG